MRVGHFVPHYPGGGGITSMVLGLSQGLLDAGHPVLVYGYGAGTPRDQEATRRRAATIGLEERLSATTPHPLLLRMRADDTLQALRINSDELDVLVVHGIFGPYSPIISTAAQRGGIITIACPHDPYSPEIFAERRFAKRAYTRFLERPYLRSTQGIHLLAPSHAAFLRDLGVSTPSFVVPNGLPISAFEIPLAERVREPGSSGLRLLYLGRWDIHNKGLDILFEAIAASVGSGLSVTLRLGGHGTRMQRARLEEQIDRLGVAGTVQLVGFIEDRDQAIREADALVLPSRFDGFAQVVLEALALGTPALVSSRAGASEHLGRTDGVIQLQPTAQGVISAIADAAEHAADLHNSVLRARPSLAERFSWDRITRRWIEQVEAITSIRGVRRG